MKIQRIHVQNFKAVESQEINLQGASVIVTARNNSGKTSVLRGLIDRFHSHKPTIIVKQGEEKGFNSLELTDGSKIEWKFTEKSESFTYTTKDGFKQTTGVLQTLSERYFGKQFNIDFFLNLGAKQQEKELLKILGVDTEDIENKYNEAYEDRAIKNKTLKAIISENKQKPEVVNYIDPSEIISKLEAVKEQNVQYLSVQNKVNELENIKRRVNDVIKGTEFEAFFDVSRAESVINELMQKHPEKLSTSDLENQLENIRRNNVNYELYMERLSQYDEWVKKGTIARKEAEEADKKVKEINTEKENLLKNASMPEGFSFDENGLVYNELPLTESQVSSSTKYIAALKIAKLGLGELKTLHFDASTLDNISLKEILKWARSHDLQLLVERPDYDGGEIKYEIIED